MEDWDDLRHFLAVADTGSTLAAGRKLRVSQTTCARRVAALETRLGVRLFDRKPAGYLLTSDGAALLGAAQGAADAVEAFAQAAESRARAARSVVRLTASEIFAVTMLAPVLRDFHDARPDIRIELDTSDEVRDLAAGAADIAIRIAGSPSGAGVIGRRVADDDWAIYCSRGFAAARGIPRSIEELRGMPIIGGGEEGVWRMYGEYLRHFGLVDSMVMQHNTSLGLLAAVRSGLGLSALPCLVADHEPDLICCFRTPQPTRGMWLLIHERSRGEPRIRTVVDFLYTRLVHATQRDAGQVATVTT
ncbi:LysR family transcriptional regulator [Sphingomonas radiodurans]|uniref:LysR family transcriptional regulator n=1 Tax=Sphingomonas radiodurans TaxID=2890321 RepID=UPI001E43EFED|nr:LysR family transcriptional regulator [Sphingomonas radiodurans]WBH16522.1 LysR family transcriptional regulator [Sphingomonas radiodurans]